MVTRSVINIKNESENGYLYRHLDGYPKGTLSTLLPFFKLVTNGNIKPDTSPGLGNFCRWLVYIGHVEKEVEDGKDYDIKKNRFSEYQNEGETGGNHDDMMYEYRIFFHLGDVDTSYLEIWKYDEIMDTIYSCEIEEAMEKYKLPMDDMDKILGGISNVDFHNTIEEFPEYKA